MAARSLKQQTYGMTGTYPANWPEIAKRIKDAAGWKCERCGHPHDRESGHVLTTAHLIPDKSLVEDWNLAALCQRCHLSIQGRVDFVQGWMFDHSEWLKPHIAGWLTSRWGKHEIVHEGESGKTEQA